MIKTKPSPYREASRAASGKERDGGMAGEDGIGGSVGAEFKSIFYVGEDVAFIEIRLEYVPRELVADTVSIQRMLNATSSAESPEAYVEEMARKFAEVVAPLTLQIQTNVNLNGVISHPNAQWMHPDVRRMQQQNQPSIATAGPIPRM